jgi:hypothetical protein
MKMQTMLTTLVLGTLCQFGLASARAQVVQSAPTPTVKPAGESEVKRGPGQIIEEKLRSEVRAKLAAVGAGVDELKVTVVVRRSSGTPFKVSYRGLRGFKGVDGTTPDADGSFVMEYIGGGQWQGTLAGTQFTVAVGTKDNIDLPFVNDPQVLGEWESIDFVPDIAAFEPAQPLWKEKLYLKGLTFLENGKTPQPWFTWTKGFVLHHGDQTASRYEVREVKGGQYLFFEWKSGDVTIAGMKPHYYVLRPKAAKS